MQTGVLIDTDLLQLHSTQAIFSPKAFAPNQVQPASLDLRLGPVAYRVQAGFITGKGTTVTQRISTLKMSELNLTQPQLLERGAVYIVPLMESLKLPPNIHGGASPKSSTGRLDIFVRLLLDNATTYDTVPAGYHGPLYLEISPLTFPIVARAGDRLTQLRLRHTNEDCIISDADLTKLHEKTPLLRNLQQSLLEYPPVVRFNQGLWISLDLHGTSMEDDPIIGYRARRHTQPVDLARIGQYAWRDYWEPINRNSTTPLILYPEEFYIFSSKEGIYVPPEYAAELVAYDTRLGEIRVHYAGFFDPGWGQSAFGKYHGTTAVLEVRAHDVPCVLEDGQPIGRFLYEKLTAKPAALYGSGIGSNYSGQGLKLAKQFRMDA